MIDAMTTKLTKMRTVTQRRQDASAILAGCAARRIDVVEGKESPHPTERELTFHRDGERLAGESTSRLATRKELEAEGSPIMDDRANDGRGARMASMASEGAGGRAASQSWPNFMVLVKSGHEVTYG